MGQERGQQQLHVHTNGGREAAMKIEKDDSSFQPGYQHNYYSSDPELCGAIVDQRPVAPPLPEQTASENGL